MAVAWIPPTPRAKALIRRAAEQFLDEPAGLINQVDAAILSAAPAPLRDELALASEVAASNRANIVHWATCNLHDPGARVPVNLSTEVLAIARDAVRRGLDEAILATYRVGQNIAWRYTMHLVFALSDDPEEIRETLDAGAQSIFTFVDDTLAALSEQLDLERSELTRGTHAERFEVVTLLLEGTIGEARASERLGYDLARRHTAAIVWSEPGVDHPTLMRGADALARAAGAPHPLTVVASATTLWVWFASADLDAEAARAAIAEIPGVRAALGPPAAGSEGFRRSHLDAVAAQRLMFRMPADLRVAGFEDVQLVALATSDAERAAEFVARTLGDLAGADAELRQTLRVYIREQFSASRAARALFAHRNTVLNRLQRAERMLPAPLDQRGLEVGLALEIRHWLGPSDAGP
ncbi:MAG TPA: helix-turn-helix domain-containing protein [Solirubrobacteraceae bacterium]